MSTNQLLVDTQVNGTGFTVTLTPGRPYRWNVQLHRPSLFPDAGSAAGRSDKSDTGIDQQSGADDVQQQCHTRLEQLRRRDLVRSGRARHVHQPGGGRYPGQRH